MIGRRRPNAPAPDPWEEEGRALAPQLAGVSAAVVMGRDASAAARTALGAARAIARERRVAVADLIGAAAVFGPLAGGTDGPGITDGFVRGISLNDVARPAADGTSGLFILPRGSEPLSAELLSSDRWRRLAAGFAHAGALLLVVAHSDEPGLDGLVRQTDGVVAVGDARVPIEWRVLAQAGDQHVESRAPEAAPARPRSRAARAAGIAAGLALLAGGAALWVRTHRAPAGPAPAAFPADTRQAAAVPSPAGPPVDTVRVSNPVNPPDSAAAAQFAVELVATNTVTGANLWIRERGLRLPGLTVSPVVMGAARARWHKVLAGAWRDRAGADSLLQALRDEGVLRRGTGAVVRVPLALLLEADMPREAAAARIAALAARGVSVYALLQDDGTVRLFAGAFDTAAAAVPLDADLRGAGLAPALAYRTGRTF